MLNIDFPPEIESSHKLDYRCLQLVSSVFSAFREYWGCSIHEALELFQHHNIYGFIKDNYDFYHTVGKIYIVEDVRECLGLPGGSWNGEKYR